MDSKSSHAIRTLLVDDHYHLRQELAEFLLINTKIDIIGLASNGEEALLQYIKEKPDLVLMDQNMSGLDGIETCKKMSQIDPSLIIIILSNFGDHNRKLEAINAGATYYLQKENTSNLLNILGILTKIKE